MTFAPPWGPMASFKTHALGPTNENENENENKNENEN